ncbi:hypothetical protein DICVIV_11828 [Dictyocaulus viviparus]|uniref:Uncharacterized protein n=1 Tax=Dictyocaulus viviparus TaxID=29172 RepID=A0A0D8XC77_DICVI|nr:hypothetical protein DICVIV_11828 [Dictyocaulus viviparus]
MKFDTVMYIMDDHENDFWSCLWVIFESRIDSINRSVTIGVIIGRQTKFQNEMVERERDGIRWGTLRDSDLIFKAHFIMCYALEEEGVQVSCTATAGLDSGVTLSLGLQLVPSEIDYLVVGKNDDEEESDDDIANNIEDFWQLELAGIEEYSRTIMQERQQQDMLVEETFMETIEKKSDGYFVRLPW